MASIIEGIGLIAGVLGIISFGKSNFAADPLPGSTTKIATALNGSNNGTSNAGGGLPGVYVSLSPSPSPNLN